MNTGAFGENFPYSNYHDLNTDWIIKIAKDFLDQYTHIQETIDLGLTSLDNKATELENLLQQWYDTHSDDIANQLADALEDINAKLASAISAFNTAAEQKAQQTIQSIPSDYTALSNTVTNMQYAMNSTFISYASMLYCILNNKNPVFLWKQGAFTTEGYSQLNDQITTDVLAFPPRIAITLTAPANANVQPTIREFVYNADGTFTRTNVYSGNVGGSIKVITQKDKYYCFGNFNSNGITPSEGELNTITMTPFEFQNILDDLEQGIISNGEDISNIANNTNSKWTLRRMNKKKFTEYTIPFNTPIKIATDGYSYLYNFNIEDYKNPENEVFYVSPNGLTNNDGLTPETPKLLRDFLSHGELIDRDNVTVLLMDGIYRNLAAELKQKAYRNMNFIALHKNKAIIANASAPLTYTIDSTYTNCYTTIRSNILKILQKADNEYLMLLNVGSPELCNSTPGSWHKDNSDRLYLHPFMGVTPTFENMFVCLNYGLPAFEIGNQYQNTSVYLEGITFLGGSPATLKVANSSSFPNANIYAKDCKFIGAYDETLSYDAVSILGANAYFVNCTASFASKDGFNYHAYNNKVANFIEIDCEGCNNGIDKKAEQQSARWQNGSTAHDGSKGVRINGTYYNNYGANVADIGTGTITININCKAFDTAYTGNDTLVNCDFSAQQPGSTMYLENCVAFGSRCSYNSAEGSNIYLNNCDMENPPT